MEFLDDASNLRLLRYLVSGTGVNVNYQAISKDLKIHRATVKRKIKYLLDSNILSPPFYSFPYLYEVYPLLILVKADMPRSNEVIEFLKDDSHIFAAFSCMEGPYNTFLIEFFKNLESYHNWREQIVKDQKIPARENRAPADAYIFSNKLTFKYNPNCYIHELEEQFIKKNSLNINNIHLDKTSFAIFKNLLMGKYIQRNDSFLSRELELNRKTINHRVELLLNKKIIGTPKCFFPNLFIPPGYNLVVSMIEVKSKKQSIINYIINNFNISRAQEASTGRYNFLLFSAFRTIEDFFKMGEDILNQFPESIGAISNTILSSKMIHAIKPQKLSVAWIERRLWKIRNTK